MTITPPIAPDWLVTAAISALKQVPNVSDKLISQVQGKLIPLNFAIFGFRGTGKTTILNRMQFGIPTNPSPTIALNELDEFEVYIVGKGNQRVKGIYDVPGSPDEANLKTKKGNQWHDWEKVYLGQFPKGIIFVIDHINKNKSKEALKFVIEMIKQADEPQSNFLLRLLFGKRRRKARKNLKIFYLLVNKKDEWENKGLTIGDITKDYADEIEEITRFMLQNKGRFYIEQISALTGSNFEMFINNFMLGMLAVSQK